MLATQQDPNRQNLGHSGVKDPTWGAGECSLEGRLSEVKSLLDFVVLDSVIVEAVDTHCDFQRHVDTLRPGELGHIWHILRGRKARLALKNHTI